MTSKHSVSYKSLIYPSVWRLCLDDLSQLRRAMTSYELMDHSFSTRPVTTRSQQHLKTLSNCCNIQSDLLWVDLLSSHERTHKTLSRRNGVSKMKEAILDHELRVTMQLNQNFCWRRNRDRNDDFRRLLNELSELSVTLATELTGLLTDDRG